jgi:hypothetical protein
MVELLVAAVILVLSVALVRHALVTRRRGKLRGSITEEQARENAAPLSTAILASDRRERPARDAAFSAAGEDALR